MSGKPFSNKVALVTGSARGIGRAIAEDLAEWGANQVILDVRQEDCDKTASEIAATYGVKAVGVACNITKKSDVEAAADKVKSTFGTLHFLVNNAGVLKDNLLLRMKEEEWDLVMNVNLKGAFLMTQAMMRYMMKAEGGSRIVNVSSISGVLGQVGQANYSSSKAGLIGLTKVTAREYASKGVLCNAICPGFVLTDLTKDLPEEVKTALQDMVPLKRAGTVKDISRVVRFLCSEDASYITGNIIKIDGGAATGF
ncbi:MAG: 3-oxoacyl-ACP reductase FabG [Spirochaetia bacterium]|nr:3-oxoacyl-ACP reductase FabG [Spirochaetia bacterium]